MRKGSVNPHLWKAKVKKCILCGKEFRAIKDTKEYKQKYCSKECWSHRAQIRITCKYCGKEIITTKSRNKKYCNIECRNNDYKERLKGETSPAWKGGKTSIVKRRKSSIEYKKFRDKIFKRDNYRCQACGEKTRTLEVHHIKEQSKYPELMLDPNNVITLCHACHKETDNYGWKAQKKGTT